MRAPSSGRVLYNGRDLYENLAYFRRALGYVPQDDIVHKELPVERTLQYAAMLRLPSDVQAAERNSVVEQVIRELGLTAQTDQPVGSLSGGQRKRVSIGAELLTRPGAFFLDEPTSGLDPATGIELMRLLRELANSGSTVVLTTHTPEDIGFCDRVVFLAQGGQVAFAGTPDEALEYFGVQAFAEIYQRVSSEDTPRRWAERFRSLEQVNGAEESASASEFRDLSSGPTPRTPGSFRQWSVLTTRNLEILLRNKLTLAILVGAPIAVIVMFAVLFRPGAFDFEDPSPSAAIMILFWLAFGAFFFGLTYGLLEITKEFPVFNRERLVNLKVIPYVLSKVAVLLPILAGVLATMLVVLRVFDLLPDGDGELYLSLFATLLLAGLASLSLGLLASASVSSSEQASLALPMLSFPQVLFSGAILAVPIMGQVGQLIGLLTSTRWTFEALGQAVDLNRLLAEGGSPLGPPLLAEYQDTFSRPLLEHWLLLATFTVAFLAATAVLLAYRSGSRS